MHVATERPLRLPFQRRARREGDARDGGELVRDLHGRVAAADHDDAPAGEAGGAAVLRGVQERAAIRLLAGQPRPMWPPEATARCNDVRRVQHEARLGLDLEGLVVEHGDARHALAGADVGSSQSA